MKEIFKSIKRSPYQSLASFLILFFSLFLSLFFFNLTTFANALLSDVETKPQVTIYFLTDVTEKDIFEIRDEIVDSGKTSQVNYVSKEDALKIYKEFNKDNPLLTEMVSAQSLPASLEIFATKPIYLQEIAEFAKKQAGVDEVDFQKNIVDQLISLTTILRRVSLAVFAFLIFISIIVLTTTTAFKIALKKREIELLRLLGASKMHVYKPFLLEGIFFGVVSGTIAFFIFYGIILYFYPFLKSYLEGIGDMPFYNLGSAGLYVWPPSIQYVLLSYLLIVGFGALIGLLGNWFSTSKHIK